MFHEYASTQWLLRYVVRLYDIAPQFALSELAAPGLSVRASGQTNEGLNGVA